MKASFGDPARLDAATHGQYLGPFPDAASRRGTWVFPRSIVGETAWLGELWARRAALADLPAPLAWGTKDPAFAPLLPR